MLLTDGPKTPRREQTYSLRGDLLAIVRIPSYWTIVAENVLASIGLWMFFT
jgi:hypothetical protein